MNAPLCKNGVVNRRSRRHRDDGDPPVNPSRKTEVCSARILLLVIRESVDVAGRGSHSDRPAGSPYNGKSAQDRLGATKQVRTIGQRRCGDGSMVSQCANPKCAKPLHYLRDGRVFVFDVGASETSVNGKRMRKMEHFWLCGECSRTLAMEQSPEGVKLVPRTRRRVEAFPMAPSAMAS